MTKKIEEPSTCFSKGLGLIITLALQNSECRNGDKTEEGKVDLGNTNVLENTW